MITGNKLLAIFFKGFGHTKLMFGCCVVFFVFFFNFIFFFLQPAKQQRRPGVSHLSSLPQPPASPGWVCRRRSKSSTFPHSPLKRSRRYTNTMSPSWAPMAFLLRMTSRQHSQHLFLLVWQLEKMRHQKPNAVSWRLTCVCLSLSELWSPFQSQWQSSGRFILPPVKSE